MSILSQYSEQFRAPYWMLAIRLAIILIGAWAVGPILAKRLSVGEPGPGRLRGWIILTAIVTWVVLFSVGMLRHLTFHSKAWDLAIFDQVIWNLANGYGWECSVRGMHDLRGDHFEPILLMFVPIYKVLPSVAWLLGIQAAALTGAGLILRATYRERIGEIPSFILFVAFCLYAPVHWLSLADFHPIALAPLFIAIAWFGSRKNNLYWFLIGLIGLAACGEEGLIVGGWWGAWEFLSRRPWRQTGNENPGTNRILGWVGCALLPIFWAAFVYLSLSYIPAHRIEGEGYFYVHRYVYLGSSVGEIAKNFVLRPGLWIRHAFDSRGLALLALYLVPLALIPLRRPGTLALLIPTALYTLLSVADDQRSIFHQYTAVWIPFLFIAAGEGMIVLRTTASWSMDMRMNPKIVQMRLATGLLVASILGFLAFSPIFGLSMHPEFLTPEYWAAEAKGVVQSVKPQEAVSAPSALCPHLSHRRMLLRQPETVWGGEEVVVVLPEFPPPG